METRISPERKNSTHLSERTKVIGAIALTGAIVAGGIVLNNAVNHPIEVSPETHQYVVHEGDTLAGIAQREYPDNDISSNTEANIIMDVNHLDSPEIKPTQGLQLPDSIEKG